MTVRGILNQMFQVGGETEGWILMPLDSTDEVELESGEVDLNPFLGKYVEIEGEEKTRWGIERGNYTVIVVNAIKEIND